MAEVPPGPSALPASTAESIPFPGGGCAVLGEGEERGCGRGEPGKPGSGQHQQAGDGKGASKTNQKHIHSHQSAHFHSQTQQQLNGLISSSEDGLLPGHHHSCVHSHLHHPVHRPPDSQRGQSEHCDGNGEAHDSVQENNNSFCDGNSNCQREPGSCLHQNHAHSNNGISDILSLVRTEQNPRKVSGQEICSKGNHDSTGHRSGPDAGSDEETAMDGRDHATHRGEVGLSQSFAAATAAEIHIPVAEIARLDLNNTLEREEAGPAIQYVRYESELQMPDIMRLITKDLSEPYSIYTYRYFIHNWPQLCFLAMVQQECVGAIVCKLDMHKKMFRRGYIAMLAVDSKYRRRCIGTNLVKKAIYAMVEGDCDEVVLETEITNKSALKLYENLGFVRDKRLFRYYLNGVDALRLKLWLR